MGEDPILLPMAEPQEVARKTGVRQGGLSPVGYRRERGYRFFFQPALWNGGRNATETGAGAGRGFTGGGEPPVAIPAGGGTHAVKQGIGTLFGENSYLTYALQKSADMLKYGMYQKGYLGDELKAKYEGQATFDLAGGVDFTIYARQGVDAKGETTLYGGVGVQITSKGMRVHNGAGEFGGLAFVMGTNGQVVWQGVETWESTVDGVILAGWQFTEWVVNAMSVFETAIEDSGRETFLKLRDWNTISNGNRVFYDKQDGKEWTNAWQEVQREGIESEKGMKALWKIMTMFIQDVTKERDLTDQIEDGIVRQMEKISNANFAMGISGTNAMMLRDALLSRDAQKFTNAVEAILKTNDMLGERKKGELNLKRYMYGLKYMYDNRDEAAVQIANKSCSSVAFYLVTALSGRLDPLKTDFVSYWTTQFENGLLGSDSNGPGTYEKPPVAVGWWGWGGQQVSHNIPFIQKFSISLDREYEFWAGWVPGINGGESRRWDGDGGLSALMSRYEAWRTESGHLEGQGQRWAVERRQLLGGWMKKYEEDFLPGYQALLQTNMKRPLHECAKVSKVVKNKK